MDYTVNQPFPSALSMEFLRGMAGEEQMAFSPQPSFIDYDEGLSLDSMFTSPTDTQAFSQETIYDPRAFAPQAVPIAPASNTTIQTALGIDVPLHNGAIGDRFYGIQQAVPQHARTPSLTSPSIMIHSDPLFTTQVQPKLGQYFDRDFVDGGENQICIQTSEELASLGTDMDLMNKVTQGWNIQRPLAKDLNSTGVVALRIGLADICHGLGRIGPTDGMLLTYLAQELARDKNNNDAPIVDSTTGIDRPLAVNHLLMMLHRYSLRNNNERYNLGIVRQLYPAETLSFGEALTFGVTLEGSRERDCKTLWILEQMPGVFYPLAPDNFAQRSKSYAEALKTPSTQRPVTPLTSRAPASSNAYLHPYSTALTSTPSTNRTTSSAHTAVSMSRTQSSLSNTSSIASSSAARPASTSNTNTNTCRHCGRTFLHHADLMQHARIHKSRNLVCPHCARSFHWNKDLQRHVATHNKKEERLDFVCQVDGCGRAYTRGDNLRRHRRVEHAELPPLPPGSTRSVASASVGGRSRAGSRAGWGLGGR